MFQKLCAAPDSLLPEPVAANWIYMPSPTLPSIGATANTRLDAERQLAVNPRLPARNAAGCRLNFLMFPRQLLAIRMRSNPIKMTGDPPLRRTSKTIVFLAVAVLANSFGTLMLAVGMNRMPDFSHVPFHTYLLGLIENPFVLPGAALLAIYALAQLSLFSWADLSYVIPCTASSYILSTILAEFVLNEHVQLARWLGVFLIFLGVTLVAETPMTTKSRTPQAPT